MRFCVEIPIRVSDLNYGNHLGYDRLVSILHQSRLKYLQFLGLKEDNIDGTGMIMKHLEVDYQGEAFFDDLLNVNIEFVPERTAVKAKYVITKNDSSQKVATAEETILFMNYETKKVKRLPKVFLEVIEGNYFK